MSLFIITLNRINFLFYFQNKQVVVLWDEDDYHSKHMFGESIARARSLLHIATCKTTKQKSFWHFGKFFFVDFC